MSEIPELHKGYVLLSELRTCLKNASSEFLLAGKILTEIREKKLHPKRQFYQYITENVNIGRQTINDMMRSWQKFGPIIEKNPDLQGIDPTKMRRLLPYVKDDAPEEQVIDLLYDAKELSVSDLTKKLMEGDEKTQWADCTHSGNIEIIKRCTRCGKTIFHSKESLDEIKKNWDFGKGKEAEKKEIGQKDPGAETGRDHLDDRLGEGSPDLPEVRRAPGQE